MKKVLFIFIIWFFTSAFLPGDYVFNKSMEDGYIWISATGEGQPAPVKIETQSVSETSITLTVSFSGIWARVKETDQGNFTELYFDEFGDFAQLGSPKLPQFTSMLELSDGKSVDIKNVQFHSTSVQLSDFNLPKIIFPMQPEMRKSKTLQDWVPPNANIYETDQFFPHEFVQLTSPFQQRDHNIQPVQFFPVRYNPVSGELQIIQTITVEINWQTPSFTEKYPNEQLKNSLFDSLYPEMIESPVGTMDEPKLITYGSGYLIISPDSFLSQLSPFLSLKQSQGYDVSLVSLSEIGSSTTDGIQKFIQNAYDTWENPPVYLLLVGDSNIIPAWSFKLSDIQTYGKKTDLYYATMDGAADFVPDIFYGRLPARDATQLNAMLSKIIAYSQKDGSEPWVKKAAFISTCDSGNYTIPIGSHDYVINTFTSSLGFTGIFPINPQPGGDKLYCRTGITTVNPNISSNILTAINDQRSLVTYSGHGSKTAWQDPSFINIYQSDIQNLLANQITPFVSSFACETGDFANETTTESFGETWMIQSQKGAIAYLGSADYSYWGPDDRLERNMFVSLFSNPSEPPPVAQAIFSGLQAVQTYNPTYARYYWETYNLLGDPSTQIWIGPRPSDFAISFPDGNIAMCAGEEKNSLVQVVSYDGFSEPVSLSLLDLPGNVTGQFSPNPITPTSFSTLNLTTDLLTNIGNYEVTLQGDGGEMQHNIQFQLTINNTIPDAPILLSPSNFSSNQSLLPTFTWQSPAQFTSFRIQVALDPDFTRIMLDEDDLSTPVFTPSISLESLTSYYWRVKALNGCGESTFSPTFTFTTRRDTGDCEHISDTVVLNENDFESDLTGWTSTDWLWDVGRFMSPNHAYLGSAPGSISDQKLISPIISIPVASTKTTLRFWQWRNLEAGTSMCFDGGNLEFSTNGGTNWSPVLNTMILSEPYDGLVSSNFSNPLGGKYAWCEQKDWIKTVVDISSLAGQNTTFRFRLGTDYSTATEGWYVDDFRVQACIESYLFTIACLPTEKSALNGQFVTYPILITNNSRPDSYHISVEQNSWLVLLDTEDTGTLDYNEAVTINATVFIPFDTIPDSYDIAKITVISNADNNVKQEISLTTTAIETFFQFLPLLQK